MVTFEFLRRIDNVLFYAYYPNGKGEPGEVSLSVDGTNWEWVKVSPSNEAGTFAEHTLSKVRKLMRETGEIPKEGISAWY